MLRWPSPVRVFVCLHPVDMRRSFDGLAAEAEHVMRQDPLSGHRKRPVKGIFRKRPVKGIFPNSW